MTNDETISRTIWLYTSPDTIRAFASQKRAIAHFQKHHGRIQKIHFEDIQGRKQ